MSTNLNTLNLYNTLVRPAASDKIVLGSQVEGGYFVCETLPSWGTVGQLCYCTGDSKFHQYDGTDWVEAKLGGTDDLIASSKTESIYTWNGPIDVTDYPSGFDTPEIWKGSSYNAECPYWTAYEVKAGHTYHVGVAEYPSSPSDRYSTVLIYDQVGGNLIGQTEGITFDNSDFLLETGPLYIYNGLTFTAPVSGIAYVGTGIGSIILNSGVESTPVSGQVKINGDLEITGDLSFGADSHLVFGTIEGSDFIADYAKVKNIPVEDDDVVNKAYFDANKGSGGGSLPSGATEGAFLRYRNGAPVWEVIPAAEDYTF